MLLTTNKFTDKINRCWKPIGYDFWYSIIQPSSSAQPFVVCFSILKGGEGGSLTNSPFIHSVTTVHHNQKICFFGPSWMNESIESSTNEESSRIHYSSWMNRIESIRSDRSIIVICRKKLRTASSNPKSYMDRTTMRRSSHTRQINKISWLAKTLFTSKILIVQ